MVCTGIRDNFNNSDENLDGRLSMDEFHHLQWPVKASVAAQSEFFNLCDFNTDSFVDLGELEKVLSYIHNKLTGPPGPSLTVQPSSSPSLSLL